MKNNLIRKSNFLVEASYKLSAIEQKIVLALASMIKQDDQEFKKYTFQLKDVFGFLGLNSNNAYDYMKKITKNLLGKVFTINIPGSSLQTHWISSANYHEGEGSVEFCFDPQLKPFLLQLKERFTTFKLQEVVQFKSSFSIRMYELLKQYEKIGTRTFEIKHLRELLGIEDTQYHLYADFKKRVILAAQEEMSEKSDISFSFEEVKIGHAIGKIKLNITTKPKIPYILPPDFTFPENMKSATINENPDLRKLYDIIPDDFREKESVRKVVKTAFEKHGFDFVMRNIVLSNEKSNAVNPDSNIEKGSNYRAYLTKALHGDYGLAYQEDQATKKVSQQKHFKTVTEAEKKQKQDLAKILIEQEDREKARVFMKSFAQETMETFEIKAQERLSQDALNRYKRKETIGLFEFKRKMEEVVMEHMGIRKPHVVEPQPDESQPNSAGTQTTSE